MRNATGLGLSCQTLSTPGLETLWGREMQSVTRPRDVSEVLVDSCKSNTSRA